MRYFLASLSFYCLFVRCVTNDAKGGEKVVFILAAVASMISLTSVWGAKPLCKQQHSEQTTGWQTCKIPHAKLGFKWNPSLWSWHYGTRGSAPISAQERAKEQQFFLKKKEKFQINVFFISIIHISPKWRDDEGNLNHQTIGLSIIQIGGHHKMNGIRTDDQRA